MDLNQFDNFNCCKDNDNNREPQGESVNFRDFFYLFYGFRVFRHDAVNHTGVVSYNDFIPESRLLFILCLIHRVALYKNLKVHAINNLVVKRIVGGVRNVVVYNAVFVFNDTLSHASRKQQNE